MGSSPVSVDIVFFLTSSVIFSPYSSSLSRAPTFSSSASSVREDLRCDVHRRPERARPEVHNFRGTSVVHRLMTPLLVGLDAFQTRDSSVVSQLKEDIVGEKDGRWDLSLGELEPVEPTHQQRCRIEAPSFSPATSYSNFELCSSNIKNHSHVSISEDIASAPTTAHAAGQMLWILWSVWSDADHGLPAYAIH